MSEREMTRAGVQAKGRVERNHGTHQDRLVKKLRRKKISTHAAVNRYLEEEYCDDHNRRFAIDATSEVDYHLPGPGAKQRREIFRLETERVLGNDWVVRHQNRMYQVQYRGQKLPWHVVEERPRKPDAVASKRRKRSSPPAAHMPNHPWRRSDQDMQLRPELGAARGLVSKASTCAPP